jgi:hypothetical protein
MALWIWSNPESEAFSKKVLRPDSIEQGMARPTLEKKAKKPRCCLCSKLMSDGGIVIEERPTAEDGSLQKWFYCPKCWVELRKLREPAKARKQLISTSDVSAKVELDES